MDITTALEGVGGALAAYGIFSTYYAAYRAGYRAGQKSRRHGRTPAAKPAKPARAPAETTGNVVEFRTAGQIGKAIAEEMARKKPDAATVERLAKLQNEYRALGRV